MKNFKRLFVMLIMSASIFTACADNSNSEDVAADGECGEPLSSYNVIMVNDDVDSPTTWTYGNLYVINKYDFYVESTLTLEPGVIIKFHPVNGPYMMLDSTSGRIVADGNACRPVIFTSYMDDSHGGDTNGDGSATSPVRRDWDYISTNGSENSVFDYCEFYYGGGGSYISTLEIYDSRVTVTNCVFAHNRGGKDGSFYYGALDANFATSGSIITGNLFYDNTLPFSISPVINIDDSNTFHSGSDTNTYNGIFLRSSYDFDIDITWAEIEVAFVIDDGDLWINSGAHLTLANNVVLKFTTGSILLLQSGSSALVNHNGAGINFTSFKDDSLKGDTNGNGNTSPATGDWGGIYDDTSPGPNYYFGWSNILYDSH
jgi:hypothetical protein